MMDDAFVAGIEQLLRERQETVTAAESCTGGLLAGRITDIPGSSDILRESFVTYCDEAKHELLGVRWDTLTAWTAVSEQTAREMAAGAARRAGADAALSVTGYAGPPASDDDPDNGLVYIGCFYRGSVTVRECRFPGNRAQVRQAAVEKALRLLDECMRNTGETK